MKSLGVGKKAFELKLQEEAEELVKEIAKLEGKPSYLKKLLNYAVCNIMCSIVFEER